MSRQALFSDGSLRILRAAAREAGALILSHYHTGTRVESKQDASPVTEADRGADRLIVAALRGLAADIPIVSEEGEQPDVAAAERFWLVDPLDGTRSFIRGEGHFTVNIGLIERGKPILGVVLEPVLDRLYWNDGPSAFRSVQGGPPEPIRARRRLEGEEATALVSHRRVDPEMDEFLAARGITRRLAVASSYKFCLLAEGAADTYVRFGPTSEWDTAAGHAILNAAGGSMTTLEGEPFAYGKPDFLNGGFVAGGA